jgi:hypothetical protein
MATQYTPEQQQAIASAQQFAQQSIQDGFAALANAKPINPSSPDLQGMQSRQYTDQEKKDLADYGRFLSAGLPPSGLRGFDDDTYYRLGLDAASGNRVPGVMDTANINMSNWAGTTNWLNGVGMTSPSLSLEQYLALRGTSGTSGTSGVDGATPVAPSAPPPPSPTQNTINNIVNAPDRTPTYQAYAAAPKAFPSSLDAAGNLQAWNPTLGAIDPATETVQGQMQGLLAANSPYMQLARQNALATANNRGLLNTSIAAGAGEKAAIESALPIANADAQLYNQQSMANQNAQNQAGQFNAAENNALVKAQYQSMLQDIMNYNNSQYDMQKMSFDEGIKTRLTALQQDYAVELETLKQSYNITQNRDTQMGVMYQDAMKSIATFLNRAELTPEQQSSGVKVIIDNLNAGLQFMAGIGAPTGANNYQSSTSYKPPAG